MASLQVSTGGHHLQMVPGHCPRNDNTFVKCAHTPVPVTSQSWVLHQTMANAGERRVACQALFAAIDLPVTSNNCIQVEAS